MCSYCLSAHINLSKEIIIITDISLLLSFLTSTAFISRQIEELDKELNSLTDTKESLLSKVNVDIIILK